MKVRLFSFAITIALASLASCQTAKQSAPGSASIVGKYWKLIELNGQTVQPAQQSKREPHLILNESDKRVNGSGGCNSYFGTYQLQGDNGITFSKIGSTKMACTNDVMQVEYNFFQVFEKTNGFALRNDTLFLTRTDMSTIAKFLLSNMK